MRLFACRICGALLYFENTRCETCAATLGFDAGRLAIEALDGGSPYKFCANAAHGACNWLIRPGSAETFCRACRHNRTVPDLSVADNLARWRVLEAAKHRLIYALLRLRLPLVSRTEAPDGLAFDFLADLPEAPPVMTGHSDGLITIALKEADETERTRMRVQMGELYRTPLGHFRHEVGHYYWDRLVATDPARLDAFRALFGDERQDYAAALRAHYARGDTGEWRAAHVSLYAGSHPWEDFAETWAHFLHIVDTLDTARDFGVRVRPRVGHQPRAAGIDFDPYRAPDIAVLIDAWLPVCFAMNGLNRAMGQPDPYPFVLPPPVIEKLGFVRSLMPD